MNLNKNFGKKRKLKIRFPQKFVCFTNFQKPFYFRSMLSASWLNSILAQVSKGAVLIVTPKHISVKHVETMTIQVSFTDQPWTITCFQGEDQFCPFWDQFCHLAYIIRLGEHFCGHRPLLVEPDKVTPVEISAYTENPHVKNWVMRTTAWHCSSWIRWYKRLWSLKFCWFLISSKYLIVS